MKILLYNPDNGVTRNFMPHLWMFLLQSLTPDGHEVMLIDGNAQPMDEAGIARFVRDRTKGTIALESAALYQSLHRLQRKKLVRAWWGLSENNRRAKFYRLTTKGRRQLAVETGKWDKLAGAIARILRPAEQESEP